jgi:uncharacterized integral membrane protein
VVGPTPDLILGYFWFSDAGERRVKLSVPILRLACHAGSPKRGCHADHASCPYRLRRREGDSHRAHPSCPRTFRSGPFRAGTATGVSLVTSVAWVGVWAAAIVLIAVIAFILQNPRSVFILQNPRSVFILQNPRSVQVSFLGMHGALPLAVGLLIAMVAGVVVTLVLGTARITQVRRLARRRR